MFDKNRAMTRLEFFEAELKAWETSQKRIEMLDGQRYYEGTHDILKRKRTMIDDNGLEVEVKYLPNNKIIDNQYSKHVDQIGRAHV